MDNLLLFFALPIAVIIISIALQKILRNPILVAGIMFSIFLVVTFIINDLNFLVATIIYTIISFITAIIVLIICKLLRDFNDSSGCRIRYRNYMENENNNTNRVIAIDNNGNNDEDSNGTNGEFNNGVSARINVIPNNNNSGNICRNYRRR